MKRIWANLEEIIISFFLFAMVAVMSANIILRLTIHVSFSWMEEIVYFCFAWIIFVGASAAFKRSLHGGIDLLVRLFPESVRIVISMLSTTLIFIVCVTFVILSYQYAIATGSKVTPVLYISYFWIALSAVVGFSLMCIHSLMFLKNLFLHHDYYRTMPLYTGILDYDTVMGGVSEDVELKLHADAEKEGGVDN